jgi:hypothetical protein
MIRQFNRSKVLPIKGTGIQATLRNVLIANKGANISRGRFRVFPTSSSEARNPQIVRKKVK